MADIARLGLEVDATQVQEADKALVSLVGSSRKAEAATRDLGRSTEDAGKAQQELARMHDASRRRMAEADAKWQSERASREAQAAAESVAQSQSRAQGIMQAMEMQFQADMARIKESSARGLLTPQEARQAGQQAAADYNQGVLEVLDQTEGIRATRSTELFTEIAGSLKDVDKAGATAGMNMGRLNMTMASLARQATGTHPAITQLANSIGSLALGGTITVAALAGLAAIGFAWKKLSEDAREARREQEDSIQALERIAERRRVDALGPGGMESEQVADARARMESIAENMERIRDRIQLAARQGRDGAITAGMEALAAEEEKYQRLARLVGDGEDEIASIRSRAAERDAEAAERAAASARREWEASERTRAGLVQEIADRERLLAAYTEGLAAGEAMEVAIAREAAIRNALTGAVASQREEIARLAAESFDIGEAARAAADAAAEAAEAQARAIAEKTAALEKEAAAQAKAAEEAQKAAEQYEARMRGMKDQIDAQRRMNIATEEGADAVKELRVQLAFESAFRSELARTGIPEQAKAMGLLAAEYERLRGEITRATSGDEFKDNWLAAISAVGAGLGGLASQFANLITAFATGGWQGGLAAAAGMVGSLFRGRNRDDGTARMAEEAAKAAEALAAFTRALEQDISVRSLTARGLTNEADVRRLEIQQQKELEEAAKRWREMDMPIEEFMARLGELWILHMDEMTALLARQAERAQAEANRQQDMRGDLEVRALTAQGRDREAQQLRNQLANEREMREAINAGMDAEYLARLLVVQGMEEEAMARAEMADSMRDLTSALNAPDGVTMSLFRWRATQMVGDPGASMAGQWSSTGGGTQGSMASAPVTIHINQLPGEDSVGLANRVVDALSNAGRRGGPNPLDRARVN